MDTPVHYDFHIQPVDFILANGIDFCEGNVIKYVCRWQDKNGVDDLKKARHYLDILIEHAEKEERDYDNDNVIPYDPQKRK